MLGVLAGFVLYAIFRHIFYILIGVAIGAVLVIYLVPPPLKQLAHRLVRNLREVVVQHTDRAEAAADLHDIDPVGDPLQAGHRIR